MWWAREWPDQKQRRNSSSSSIQIKKTAAEQQTTRTEKASQRIISTYTIHEQREAYAPAPISGYVADITITSHSSHTRTTRLKRQRC